MKEKYIKMEPKEDDESDNENQDRELLGINNHQV